MATPCQMPITPHSWPSILIHFNYRSVWGESGGICYIELYHFSLHHFRFYFLAFGNGRERFENGYLSKSMYENTNPILSCNFSEFHFRYSNFHWAAFGTVWSTRLQLGPFSLCFRILFRPHQFFYNSIHLNPCAPLPNLAGKDFGCYVTAIFSKGYLSSNWTLRNLKTLTSLWDIGKIMYD
jgi:hypothetical protein